MVSAKAVYKRILVTGGAGFVGSHVVDALLADKKVERVVVVDNFDTNYDPALKEANARIHKKDKRYNLVRADICDRKRMRALFKKEQFDAVLHLAAKCDARKAVDDPEPYLHTNILGTWNLLDAAREFGVTKFVFASTSSVYGNGNKAPFVETASTDRALTAYGASKKAAEQLAYTYHHNFGIHIACLRIFNAYGERMRPDLVLPKWVRALQRGEAIKLSGKGTRRRDFTYVGDIANAFLLALRAPLSFEVLNVGSSKPVALSELLRIVEAALATKVVVIEVPSHAGSVEMTHANTKKAERMLGWKPTVTLKEGVAKYVAWLANS